MLLLLILHLTSQVPISEILEPSAAANSDVNRILALPGDGVGVDGI